MKPKFGRKAKPMINQRFENCVALEKAGYVGNNLQYRCECDCGQIFVTSAQQLRSGLTISCPSCRKRKIRQARESERLQRIERIDVHAEKYTLMNPARTKIIRGGNGIYSFFSKGKARIAAKLSGAVVVPLSEAKAIKRRALLEHK